MWFVDHNIHHPPSAWGSQCLTTFSFGWKCIFHLYNISQDTKKVILWNPLATICHSNLVVCTASDIVNCGVFPWSLFVHPFELVLHEMKLPMLLQIIYQTSSPIHRRRSADNNINLFCHKNFINPFASLQGHDGSDQAFNCQSVSQL